jgi:hypothetical protein
MSDVKQLKQFIRKMRVENQSIILVKDDGSNPDNATGLAGALSDAIIQSKIKDVFVIVVKDFDLINVANLRDMNKAGWFRREQIENLFHKISVKKPEEENKESEAESV